MLKKAIFLLIILVVAGGGWALPLPVSAAKLYAAEASRIRKPPPHPGPHFPGLYASTSEKKEQEDIEAQLKEILEQLKQLEKKLDKKMQREILPRIREEMEKLREWLKKYKKDREQDKPQWTNRTRPDRVDLAKTALQRHVHQTYSA